MLKTKLEFLPKLHSCNLFWQIAIWQSEIRSGIWENSQFKHVPDNRSRHVWLSDWLGPGCSIFFFPFDRKLRENWCACMHKSKKQECFCWDIFVLSMWNSNEEVVCCRWKNTTLVHMLFLFCHSPSTTPVFVILTYESTLPLCTEQPDARITSAHLHWPTSWLHCVFFVYALYSWTEKNACFLFFTW